MSQNPRRLALLALTPILTVSLVACGTGAAPSSAPPASSGGPSAAPSEAPADSPSTGALDHKTGATEVLLRYEETGGMIAGWNASQAPHFTLYGDGTVIFRNPLLPPPEAQGSVAPFNPMRTAKLSEDQIQELLLLALGEGGLGAARPRYDEMTISDATTTVFTVHGGGVDKTVSIYGLGFDEPTSPDAPAKAAFKKLADRLADFDQGGSIPTNVYEPTAYRGSLLESPGIVAPDILDWPWPDVAVTDFKPDADPNGLQFPHRTLTAEEVDQLKVPAHEGGFMNLVLRGDDKKLYTLALRPLLPDDSD
jgi:hypothetical protein